MIITIDGPAASGKSTVARLLAHKLRFYYLYSGLLYRALAYLLIKEYKYDKKALYHPNISDIQALLQKHRCIYCYDEQLQERIFFDGYDITPFLKKSVIDEASSIISLHATVRDLLSRMQRYIAQSYDLIVDGRDSGSVVFPEADYKFYLTAKETVRAKRWQLDQSKMGNNYTEQEAEEHIRQRDMRDAQRTAAPLIIPQGALVIDTESLTPQQVVEQMMQHIQTHKQFA